jgi:hypothetical protein
MSEWSSLELLGVRIDMLAEDLSFKIFNNALKAYASSPELASRILGLEWVADYFDPKSLPCPVCDGHAGRIWGRGEFMPRMPAHLGCKCSWRVVLRD